MYPSRTLTLTYTLLIRISNWLHITLLPGLQSHIILSYSHPLYLLSPPPPPPPSHYCTYCSSRRFPRVWMEGFVRHSSAVAPAERTYGRGLLAWQVRMRDWVGDVIRQIVRMIQIGFCWLSRSNCDSPFLYIATSHSHVLTQDGPPWHWEQESRTEWAIRSYLPLSDAVSCSWTAPILIPRIFNFVCICPS